MCYYRASMKIRVLGAFGSEGPGQRPAAMLLDDRVLIDAGTVTGALTVPEQLAIEHALISHSHLDHTAGLAYLSESLAVCGAERPVTIAAVGHVVTTLREMFFNNIVWPDFARLPSAGAPVVRYRELTEETEQSVGDFLVTPVPVHHTVPTTGFIIRDGSTALIYSGDTGPTQALWQAARRQPGLRAVILECAFPNRLRSLADLAGHMTPDSIRRELDKLPPDVPVWIYHVKPQFHEETAAELDRMSGGRIIVLEQDKTYSV
jgi:cAMP phosphodiesterase